ncbi:IS630 family transposase [Natronorubrum sp. JWXQ-INN-674]|uniref:IS630 family transposase n=1 Tax=Natronorubrum halalkaliphilum TaxID=2691917 RepID=A0A6B0VH78_9EURY|nr:IS630 family transposase [Natronorubrum halalkaliphilum]MXV60888.1 IS630 family transposase [Natronorubrum halalkaliphilum]
MTTWGGKLDGIDEEQLRQQLRTETDVKAIKRLTSALLYRQGKSPAEIEQLLGFPEQTVYDWLDTVAERGEVALGDLSRPGQSTRLTDDQWTELTATLAASPSEAGYDEPTWTPALVRDYIAETFNVEYSLAHMYRVMKRAGLSYQTARPRHYKADPAEQQRWREEFKKSGRR